MRRLHITPKVLGPVGVVLAIAVGGTLPFVLSSSGVAASLTSSPSAVAVSCSSPPVVGTAPPPTATTTPPVASFSPPCVPALSAIPSTNLADGQSITVAGTGFAPQSPVDLVECAAGNTGVLNCGEYDSGGGFGFTDANGDFSTSFTASRILIEQASDGSLTTLDCALSPCQIDASEGFEGGVTASVAINFNPAIPPLLSGTLTPTGKVNVKSGTATITGTATCTEPTTVNVEVELSQIYHRRFNFTNDGSTEVICKGGKKATKWKVSIPPGDGYFAAGKSTVEVNLQGQFQNDYEIRLLSGPVKLVATASH